MTEGEIIKNHRVSMNKFLVFTYTNTTTLNLITLTGIAIVDGPLKVPRTLHCHC